MVKMEDTKIEELIAGVLTGVLKCAKNESEYNDLKEFISNKCNEDFLEEMILFQSGYEGFCELSSGKIVYISQPRRSGKEIGESLKAISDRMRKGGV